MTATEQPTYITEPKPLSRHCWTCDYWYPGRVALQTDTTGFCLSIGSPFDRPRADDVCDLWESAE